VGGGSAEAETTAAPAPTSTSDAPSTPNSDEPRRRLGRSGPVTDWGWDSAADSGDEPP
jgi:hypothetical protein